LSALRGLERTVAAADAAETRRDHPFLIWAPFDAPARKWSFGEFHDRVGALAAGLVGRGIKPGDYVLIHLDNCIEAMLAWFACGRTRRHRRHHQHPLRPAEMDILRSLWRDCRDHPARLCQMISAHCGVCAGSR